MKCGTCQECGRDDVVLADDGTLHPHNKLITQMPCKGAYDKPIKTGIYSVSTNPGHDFIIVDASEKKPTGLGTFADVFKSKMRKI